MAGSLKKKITDLFRFYPNGRGSRWLRSPI
jgi:hypothetical protein